MMAVIGVHPFFEGHKHSPERLPSFKGQAEKQQQWLVLQLRFMTLIALLKPQCSHEPALYPHKQCRMQIALSTIISH